MRTLLAHGADPQRAAPGMDADAAAIERLHFEPELVGATPFWLAARFMQPNVMRLLVERGADPLFVHRSDRIVDGKEGRAYEHRNDATTALMAAVGMGGGGNAWVPAGQKSARGARARDGEARDRPRHRRQRREHRWPHRARRRESAQVETVVAYLVSKGAKARRHRQEGRGGQEGRSRDKRRAGCANPARKLSPPHEHSVHKEFFPALSRGPRCCSPEPRVPADLDTGAERGPRRPRLDSVVQWPGPR